MESSNVHKIHVFCGITTKFSELKQDRQNPALTKSYCHMIKIVRLREVQS